MARSTILHDVALSYFLEKPLHERYWGELQTRFFSEIIPILGTYRLISSITKKDIRLLLDYKKRYPAARRTMYDGLRPFFRWCVEYDYIPVSPMEGMSPPPASAKRDRILYEDEIKALWKATHSGYFAPFYRLCLLTGQRRMEVAGISSQEIQGDLWTIYGSRTKTKVASVVPLSDLAKREIKKAKFINYGLAGFSKSKKDIDKASGVSDWRIHDLRRTCATYLAMLSTPEHIISRILNHRVSGVRGIYNQYLYLPEKRQALQKWADYIKHLTKV